MTFIAKFLRNLSGLFSLQNTSDIFHKITLQMEQNSAEWVSLTANTRTFEGSLLTREMELLTGSDALLAQVALKEKGGLARFFKNQQLLAQGAFAENDSLAADFNLLLDQLIEKKIHTYQRKLQVLDEKNFTPEEVATEDKALEWMRVSYSLLEKAVLQSLTDPELLFQSRLFMGKNPKKRTEEIRLIAFNLDISYEFLDNHLLRVRIYNDKNEEFGSAKKASLQGDYNFRKREMLDELTRLLSAVSSGFKI